MFDSGLIPLGITAILIGLALFGLVTVLLRAASRFGSNAKVSSQPIIQANLPSNQHAVLLVQPGGKLLYINDLAREWFDLEKDEHPNLERMARNARPPEAFLSLCSTDGHTRFNLQQSLIEGTSFTVPHQGENAVLVTLERPKLTGLQDGDSNMPNQAFKIYTEISQSMSTSLDLDTTISSILKSVEELINVELSEITLLNSDAATAASYRYTVDELGIHRLEKENLALENAGLAKFLFEINKPLNSPDLPALLRENPGKFNPRPPFISFLGIPLKVGGDNIGTLELYSQREKAFSVGDQEILELLSGNAAVALQNANTHYNEQQRAIEMAGLADLAQVGSAIYEGRELYQRLLDAIAPLLQVDILGFLIFDENKNLLEGKIPFLGMPSQFVELYRSPINELSPAEEVWKSQRIIHTNDVANNEALKKLELSALAVAAAIRDTILVPLTASGRSLGYLQAANKNNGMPLDDDDMRLLQIIAGQIATILENASLVQEARRRTQRAETLSRVASLAASSATLDEILTFSVSELSRFFQAEQAAVFLLNENIGALELHANSQIGISPETQSALGRLSLESINLPEIVTGTTFPLLVNNLQIEEVPAHYKRLSTHFKELHSAMIAPLVIKEHGVGEIFLGSRNTNHYNHNDIQSLTTAASQLANAVERSMLSSQTDETLQYRVDQLSALTRVSRELSTTTNLENLLKQIYEHAIRATNANGGAVFLFKNENGEIDPNEIALSFGQRSGNSLSKLEIHTYQSGQPEIIYDFSQSHYLPPIEGIRSALVVPISYRGNITGMIHLVGRRVGQFDQVSQEISQALAIQAGIALGNAQRLMEQSNQSEKLSRRIETLSKLYHTTQSIQLDMPLEESLGKIAHSIQSSNHFEIVLIYVYDPDYGTIKPLGQAGLPKEEYDQIKHTNYLWENARRLMLPKYQRSRSYFVPYTEMSEIPSLMPEYAFMSYTIPEDTDEAWQMGDRLLLPLLRPDGEPLGLIAVDAPRNGLKPDKLSIEDLEIFTAETSMLIDSARKLNRIKPPTGALPSINGDLFAGEISQGHLANLLHKDLEQTIAIQQLHNRAQNIRVGLDIAETVNMQPDREAVLNSLASQMVTQLGLDSAIIAEPSPNGDPRLVRQLGSIQEGANPQALMGQRNPMRQSMQTGEPLFVPTLEENLTWRDTPLLRNLNAGGFISLPILLSGHVDAVILAISHSPIANFNKEDEQIYDLICNQVSITLQNLNLLTETRRRLREVNLLLEFSQGLGSVDINQILRTLVDSTRRVMPHAHGVMVSLWDAGQKSLVTRAASGYSDNDLLADVNFRPGEGLPGIVYVEGTARRVDEVDFANQYNLSPDNLMRYRQATGGRVPVSSILVPIQTVDSILGVITVDNFNTPAAFNNEDLALINSLSQQTALTVENVRLFDETRQLNEALEQRVEERTQELAREHQLSQTMLQISTELSSSLDLDHVLSRTLEMLNQATGADQSSIMLQRPGDEFYFYRAGMGIVQPPPSGGRPSSLKMGEGLIGTVIKNRRGLVIQDLHLEAIWVKNHQMNSPHRSAIVAPLIVGADAMGALMLYHREPGHFIDSQLDAVQAAANQFAVTINNGELFRLIRDQAEDLGSMLRDQQIEASRSTAMLEGVADGVLVTDKQSIITLFNDSAVKILKLPREEVVGKSLEDFGGLFGGAAQSWMQTIQNWSVDPTHISDGVVYSEQVSLEDGRVASVHLSPVSNKKEFLGTISVFRDITHEVEVDRLKSEFVATVSHELRTPMTPIKGYVEFLMMGGAGELNEKQTEFLDIIKSNIDRLSILVNDLLDVSRIEAGKVALSFQPIDLLEITQDTVETTLQKSRNEDKPIEIVIEAPNDLPSVYGDIERMRQILTNLVDNAYKYSPDNSYVIIRLFQKDGEIQVDVKDHGIGIFPDDQDRVFERFYRGENYLVMASAGTGLGLPIVKELVEMHSGKIWLTSTGVPGDGSTFSFTIPIYNPEVENIV